MPKGFTEGPLSLLEIVNCSLSKAVKKPCDIPGMMGTLVTLPRGHTQRKIVQCENMARAVLSIRDAREVALLEPLTGHLKAPFADDRREKASHDADVQRRL